MPNRIIRESLLDSDRYHGVPHDAERLLFLELLLLADDYGIVPMNFAFLRRRTTPCAGKSLEVVTAMVSALADQDLIRCYQSEKGGQFAYIPRFGNSPRALKPKWPLPPDGLSSNEIKALREKRIASATHRRAYAPETETETETETEKKKKRAETPRATRFGLLALPEDWLAYCKQKRPDLDPNRVFEDFRDYWKPKAGKDAAKLDWTATWQKWVRNEKAGNGRALSPADAAAEAIRMMEERDAQS